MSGQETEGRELSALAKQGRESIDAVALFGSVLVMSVLGRGFLKEPLKG